MWAAFPPLQLSWLAWIAPVGWILLAVQSSPLTKRDYFFIWLTGVLHWAFMLQGIRLAHWANYVGLFALAAYLACYLPLFVAALRVAIHQQRAPVVIAAPTIWVGFELARGYLLSGFSIGLLGHTQVHRTTLIQVADVFGAYTVSFLIVSVASVVTMWAVAASAERRWWSTSAVIVQLVAALMYGQLRLESARSTSMNKRPLKVALIQGSIDTVLDETEAKKRENFEHYWRLTEQACTSHSDLDVVVWPESAFTGDLPEFLVGTDLKVPADAHVSADIFRSQLTNSGNAFEDKVRQLAARVQRMAPDSSRRAKPLHLIVGGLTIEFSDTRRVYNSALHILPEGKVADRYAKMHPVPFGEYLPLGELCPWLYQLTPLSGGLTPGTSPVAFQVHDWRLCPSICFESTVPHLVRSQVVALDRHGKAPDALINVTDDGWFRGSSILDLHLFCGVFRAVETRRPYLVAANTGISAAVSGGGEILVQGPRRQAEVVMASIQRDGRPALYLWWGDWPATICAGYIVWLFVWSWRNRRQNKPLPASQPEKAK